MTHEAEVETVVLARVSGHGHYGKPWYARLVERGGKHYLVNDEWCGERELRGGMYRPRVYAVPASLVDRIAYQLGHWREYDGVLGDDGEWTSERWHSPTTHGAALQYDVLPQLGYLGEMGDHAWMSCL